MRAVGALHRSLTAVGEGLAREAGISHAGGTCLQQVADEPRTVAEIAARLGLARQGVQRVADLLVAEGLAAFADNPRHRRAKLLTPTPAGRRALGDLQDAHRRWVATAAHRLAPLDLPELTDRLRAVGDVVGRPPTDP